MQRILSAVFFLMAIGSISVASDFKVESGRRPELKDADYSGLARVGFGRGHRRGRAIAHATGKASRACHADGFLKCKRTYLEVENDSGVWTAYAIVHGIDAE